MFVYQRVLGQCQQWKKWQDKFGAKRMNSEHWTTLSLDFESFLLGFRNLVISHHSLNNCTSPTQTLVKKNPDIKAPLSGWFHFSKMMGRCHGHICAWKPQQPQTTHFFQPSSGAGWCASSSPSMLSRFISFENQSASRRSCDISCGNAMRSSSPMGSLWDCGSVNIYIVEHVQCMRLFIYLPTYLSIFPWIHRSIDLSIYLFVSIYVSIYLSVCLSICTSTN